MDMRMTAMATIENRSTENGKNTFRVRIRLKGARVATATFHRRTDAVKWEFGLARSGRRTADLKRSVCHGEASGQARMVTTGQCAPALWVADGRLGRPHRRVLPPVRHERMIRLPT